ncbi:BZ3500_MvSof-1268-A1-R1_Chr12-2g03785 [Microbotryum saponariae]|uniref:BZ3500_MvSof-1268-A1-R1_Chr12-2g03785 protein n=1 Tax=Microbotryum saponariae TaxID=289078 RepID=A0A2X0KL19_9BASI|nr:BZ3500_MvSof-1268-A1-R1_Chr12-2g03785 [Microbotryum saponariae]
MYCPWSPNLAELDKCRPMIVKQSRIQKMLRWLINESKNPAYSAVSFFNGERPAQLVRCNSGVLNSTSPAPTAVSASTSASASVSVAPQVSDRQIADGDYLVPDVVLANVVTAETVEPTSSLFEGYATTHNDSDEPVFEHVHVPPPPTDEPIHSWQFFEKALRYFNQDKPTYVIPTGDDPLWGSSDDFLLSKLQCGHTSIHSVSSQVQHWLNLYDSDFRCDPSFPFIISNILRRRDVFRHLAFRVPKEKVARIAAENLPHIDRILAFRPSTHVLQPGETSPTRSLSVRAASDPGTCQEQAPLHASHAYNQLNSCMGKLI